MKHRPGSIKRIKDARKESKGGAGQEGPSLAIGLRKLERGGGG